MGSKNNRQQQASFPSPSPPRQPTGGPPWVLIGGVVAIAALAALARDRGHDESGRRSHRGGTETTPEVTPASAPAAPPHPMHRYRHCPSYPTSCRGRPRPSPKRTRSQPATPTFSSSCRASAAARRPGIGATPIASSSLATRTAASRHGKLTGWDASCASMLRTTRHSCTGQVLRCVTSALQSKRSTNRGSLERRRRLAHSRRRARLPYLPCYNRACRPALSPLSVLPLWNGDT